MCLGLGFEFKDGYSIEMQYRTNREILGSYLDWHSDYKTFSLVLGYDVFLDLSYKRISR